MEKELAFDLFCGVGDENEILELSYATFAEELQLREILKESKIASEITKSEPSPLSSSSTSTSPSSTPEATSSTSSEPSLEELERAFNFKTEKDLKDACNEQKWINWDEKEREAEHLMPWRPRRTRPLIRPQFNFNGRRMGEIPQTSSSQVHANMSSRGENVLIAGTGNTQDPKGKGIAIDDDWLLVSKREPKSKGGKSATKRWGFEHPNPSKDSKDNNRNVVHEDDYDSLDDEDDFDSDTSQKSHESRKNSKWFKEFFERIDPLNIAEIDDTLWHCPACQGGPGATKWYRSIGDLIAHSKKIGARRVKLHREFAELLEGELRIKGTSIALADQILGNWKGLKKDARDHEIVWPPMVVIMNTMTSIFKDGKYVGMGSQELLEHFSSYPALKAQHSYGPQGHRGLSVLTFDSSAVGYLEADRLHRNFVEQGLDRFAWNSCSDVVLPGGERQLYGFMAVKEDLDTFNQHCQGKSKIKYELKSYQEAILNEIKKMSEDSQQLIWLEDRLKEERKREQTFEGSVKILSRNLQQKMKDIHIFEQRVKLLNEQNKEEMDSQENFYKDQIKILEARVKELDELQESDKILSRNLQQKMKDNHIIEQRVKLLNEQNKEEMDSQENFYKDQIKILEARVKELEKLQESDANPLHKEEPAPAVTCHMEEYTPYQYNSNLSIDED